MEPKADALRAAILVVSTSAAANASSDASEAALREVLATEAGHWEVAETKIVSDNVHQMQAQLAKWTDDNDGPLVNLILTTGGTGFTPTDQTPEAVAALLDRPASGLVHAMLAASLAVTPFAAMARPVAGVRGRTVVLTLPGSPKGACENLRAVVRLLSHACTQAAGVVDSRRLHEGGVEKLEREAGLGVRGHHHEHHSHSHSHSHGHSHAPLTRHTRPTEKPISGDPSLGPSRRHRKSPYPMVSVEEALALVAQHTPASETVTARVDESLMGAVLAEDVLAHVDVPAFRASMVDGYAVVVPQNGDMRGVFPVVSVSHAAPSETAEPLKEGQIARITTGAPLPPGASSVIMVEDTVLKSRTEDEREEKEVEILADKVQEGENIREVGSDIVSGTQILLRGHRVSSVGGEIGLLAAVGIGSVQTYRRPVVAVLSTGDELAPFERPGGLRYGEVRDTNRPTLLAAVRGWGFEAVDLGITTDDHESLEESLRDGLRCADVVVTTGGVSMGELDLLKPTVERVLGGTIHFGRVAMKPGKPTTFATVPAKDREGRRVAKAVFSLPGNPASALVAFHLFVLPSLHQASGVSPHGLTKVPVRLAHDFPVDTQRTEYHRVVVAVARDGTLSATSTGSQRSSQVGSLRGANALLRLPPGTEPLRTGSSQEALLMDQVYGHL